MAHQVKVMDNTANVIYWSDVLPNLELARIEGAQLLATLTGAYCYDIVDNANQTPSALPVANAPKVDVQATESILTDGTATPID